MIKPGRPNFARPAVAILSVICAVAAPLADGAEISRISCWSNNYTSTVTWSSAGVEWDQVGLVRTGCALNSSNGRYTAIFQGDGNFVVYSGKSELYANPGKPIWASNTGGHIGNAHMTFQGDGNVVIYGPQDSVLWSSQTYGRPGQDRGSKMVMQDDGNLVVYTSADRALWQSGTAGRT